MSMFKPAQKRHAKLRLALTGPSGSGKTYSALGIASGLGERVAVIDTEHGSAALYADRFRFDTVELQSFSPEVYVAAIRDAEAAGYDVVVIDSLSHAWVGKDGALEQVDRASHRSQSKSSYFAWRDVTPKHNALIEAIVQSRLHIIATMRARTEYTLVQDDKGRVAPKRIGLAPVQREGMEYEFSIAGELDLEHHLSITKSRCSELAGKVIVEPGAGLARDLKNWLAGPSAPEAPEVTPPAANESALSGAVREEVRASIRAAQSNEELDALVGTIQKLPEADRRAIRPDFGKRQTELAKAQPAATA